MKKLFLVLITIILVFICHSQTMICWRYEVVKYNQANGQMEPFYKRDINSEAFFSEKIIRVNDEKLFFTKRRITSRQKNENGVVMIYDVVDDKGSPLLVTTVEDKAGVFKMLVTKDDHSDYGLVYYFKGR